jgi:hypothetical protein
MRISPLLVAALGLSACTGGRVTENNQPLVNAEIRIWTCESVGNYETLTNTDGIYTFNPFQPNTPVLDLDNYIPEGPIALIVTAGSSGSQTLRRDHAYTGICKTVYNGATQDVPCRYQNVNFEPQTLQEATATLNDFFEQDCGFQRSEAERLGALFPALPGSTPFRLTSKPSQVGCITECRDSCVFSSDAQDQFQACMCSCVESNCGASFGPFCTEAGIPPSPAGSPPPTKY